VQLHKQVLVVPDAALNFGETWEDKAFRWELPIENTTSVDVEVVRFMTSCSCIAVQPEAFVIPAHGTKKVELRIDLTRRSDSEKEAAERASDIRIAPVLRSSGLQQGWTVRGRVRSEFMLSQRSIDFSAVRGNAFPSKVVEITPLRELDDLKVKCDPDSLLVKIVRLSSAPTKFQLHMSPRDNLPDGYFHSRAQLIAVRKGSESPGLLLPVQGNVMSDVLVVPARVAFGVKALGQEREQTIVVQSRNGRPYEILAYSVDSADMILAPRRQAAMDGVQIFSLRVYVSKKGDQHQVVRFTVLSEVSTKPFFIDLPVSYFGVDDNKAAPVGSLSSGDS
jgi:hypothetical protein